MPIAFREAIRKFWFIAQDYPGPKLAELIFIESPSVRRHLRAVSSGRSAITEAAGLVVGLAFMHPERLTDEAGAAHLQLARLRKTFGNNQANATRCVVQATRGMAAVEQAALLCGHRAEWITEGLDMEKVAEILAVPADHAILGLIAIHTTAEKAMAFDEFRWEEFMWNGFGGSWPKLAEPTGQTKT